MAIMNVYNIIPTDVIITAVCTLSLPPNECMTDNGKYSFTEDNS